MEKRTLFSETLTLLVEFAAAKGNEISKEDVVLYFKDLIDDESQYKFIYDYLSVNKIKVKDFIGNCPEEFSDTTDASENQKEIFSESEEELSFIKIYMEELDSIIPLSDEEKSLLISQLLDGDTSVVNRLVEANLSVVAEIAEQYRGQGVTFGDLIQEGNMGLMLGLSSYNHQSGDFDSFIRSTVNEALKNTVNAQINSDRVGQHLADKLNHLDKVTKELNEKLGRVPALEEIAEEMSISKEEVSLLLKTSLDTLSINEDSQITDETPQSESSNEDPLDWRINKK